ncbi:MAG: AMP-dependent synthetase and ligase [Frankiales bacterium]|nr:AMP-dependent synthetase and ligase [Frankiales bacterium]
MEQAYGDGLTMFRAAVSRAPEATFIKYFDGSLTFADVDRDSQALAAFLHHEGCKPGDRVGLFLQNTPQTVIGIVAAWKVGAIAVAINAMSTGPELAALTAVAGTRVLICEDALLAVVEQHVDPTVVTTVIPASPHDYQSRGDRRVLPAPVDEASLAGLRTMRGLIAEFDSADVPIHRARPESGAFITFTSGTTGAPKGAVNRHESVAFAAQVYRDWIPFAADDAILGTPPMSSITGLVVGMANALLAAIPYVLHYRYHPDVFLDAVREHRPTFLCGPSTLYVGLLDRKDIVEGDLSCFRHLYCGGAPVAPALAARWADRFGGSIRSVYGLTEATGPCHIARPGATIPVDGETGALSVGLPVFDTECRIVDSDGRDLPPGMAGELLVRGPQIIHEYWENEEATRDAIRDGWLYTGDLAKRDRDGWFYIVDRLKEIIIASGFNVSPREVEDVLLAHPGISEVAVVGVPDPYRGETIWALVAGRHDALLDEAQVMDFARENLSAYKCPRRVLFVDSLPRNVNGKLLRKQAREEAIFSQVTAPAEGAAPGAQGEGVGAR